MNIDSKNYFNKKLKWKKNYNLIVVKSKKDLNDMISYFIYFLKLKSNFKCIGMDFEFNSSTEGKKIALFQINLETEKNNANIYLFYPPDLSDKQIKVLIDLLINKDIKKVLHGAESLDIPYLFKNIFTTNKLRNKFCNNLFDTRYMCEYYNLENRNDSKCKIYHILREMDVIDDVIMKMLLDNEEKMGPIYLVDIDVRNLDEFTMLYSAFDVLYLPALLLQFPKNETYNKLIPEITCFNYIDRYEDIFNKPFSELLNKINNFFIIYEKNNFFNKIKLIDIYQTNHDKLINENQQISYLININYFKKFLKTFIKFIVYKFIYKNYKVFEKNKEKSNLINELLLLESEFQKIKLPDTFNNYFKNIRQELKTNIIINV